MGSIKVGDVVGCLCVCDGVDVVVVSMSEVVVISDEVRVNMAGNSKVTVNKEDYIEKAEE